MFDLIKKIFNLLFSYKNESQKGKKPWKSKTLWVNIFAVLGIILSKYASINLSPEDVGVFLSLVNIVLRLVTKSPTGFYEEGSS